MRTGVFYQPINNKLILVKKLDVEFKYGTLYMFQDSKYNLQVMTKWNAEKEKKGFKYVGKF
jgi:hypothetical protein